MVRAIDINQCNFSIYCLQDTHLLTKDYKYIRAQWGYDIYISGGTSDSRGVAILFNNNFEYKVLKERAGGEGNYLIMELEIAKKIKITLINIYGPNQDKPDFYNNLAKEIDNSETEFVILCGDWNLVQDKDKDYSNYVNINNPKARDEVLKIKEVYKLQDPWRIYNPLRNRYTWFKKNPIKKARLDFFLISEELMNLVDKVDINPGYKTDHSIVELELKLTDFSKGKGFWKFNNQMLLNQEYINEVKKIISDLKLRYAALTYNRDTINNLDDSEIQFTVNDQMFLELILLEIRGMSIQFSSRIKKKLKDKEKSLYRQIQFLEELIQMNDSNLLGDILSETNKELELFRQRELKGIILRSKANWIENGEKSSKYFSSLEKRNYINKTVSEIINNDGKKIVEQKEILREIFFL